MSNEQVLTNPETMSTKRGVSFVRPGGWHLEQSSASYKLSVGHEDLLLAVIESDAGEFAAAAREAWSLVEPSLQRKLIFEQVDLPLDGWDESRSLGYEVHALENAVRSAVTLRRGRQWTVMILMGSEAAFERQRAQIRTIMQSLRPTNFTPETFKGRKPTRFTPEKIAELKIFVERARDEGSIPGIAIGLIQDGDVMFAGGFGHRALMSEAPVDEDTLFLIASNTKQFTTLLLAKLVEQNRFCWETPVIDLLPEFRLGDAELTQAIQVQHLVSACTGLPRRDMEWLVGFENYTPQTVVELLKEMRPSTPFGEVFQYNNTLGAFAGYLAGYVLYPELELGAAYDKAIREYVLKPIGMNESTFSYAEARLRNHARPHAVSLSGEVHETVIDINAAAESLRPGLGMWTNVHDVLKYVQMELNKGLLPDGARYIAEKPLLRRRGPGVAFEEAASYGMGLVARERWGVSIVDHGGSFVGYRSNIFWFPELGVGGVILVNADNGDIPVFSCVRKVLELLFDGRKEADLEMSHAFKQRQKKNLEHKQNLLVPPEPLLVDGLASTYQNEVMGTLRVHKGVDTIFELQIWKSKVGSRRLGDRLSFFTIEPGAAIFEFMLTERNQQNVLIFRDGQHEYVFLPVR